MSTAKPPQGSVLSRQDHEHFLEHGFVVVRNAVDEATIQRALQRIERDPPPVSELGDPVPVVAPELIACAEGRVRRAVNEIFADDSLVDEIPFLYLPRPYQPEKADEGGRDLRFGGLHVDPEKPTMMPDAMALGIVIYLTTVRPGGGCFVFSPGSAYKSRAVMHRGYRSVFEDGFIDAYFRSAAHGLGISFPYAHRALVADAGDALLFHHLLSHIGSVNVTDPTTRSALLSRTGTTARIVPGRKRIDAMSTMERANSATCLAKRFPQYFDLPALEPRTEVDAVLREGLGGDHDAARGRTAP